ncbi:MAG: DUF308 domain-containing protein [Clostridium sp.]|nr:DUF308 domain-containing protein [Clostridium sp.]
MEEETQLEVQEVEEQEDNLEELKEQARLKAQKRQQKIRQQEINSGKKCRIGGIVAAVAGVLEIYFGFSSANATTMVIGLSFICAGYFYYNMGKRLDRKHHVNDKKETAESNK